jgi:nitrate/nitrite transporter NarK
MIGVGCMMLCCIITLIQKGSTTTKDSSVLIPILINGLGYAIFESAFWVSITYTVPEKLVGTAYGIATVAGNVSGVIAPLILAGL